MNELDEYKLREIEKLGEIATSCRMSILENAKNGLKELEKSLDDAYNDGIESFMTGQYTTTIEALGKSMNKYNREHRFKFDQGFKYAHNLIYG